MIISYRSVFILTLSIFCLFNSGLAQQMDLSIKNYKVSIESPYRLDKKKDIAVCIATSALFVTSYVIKGNKPTLDSAQVLNPDTSKIPSFDLSAIHQFNKSFQSASDILEYTAIALPFISFIDKRVSGHAPQIIALYFETLAIDAVAFSMAKALVNRRRPYTYNTDSVVSLSSKQTVNAQESFFSGHTSNAAAATFFGAKIFTDLRPHSKLVPFVWGAAILTPAFVGYSRYRAGKHFPSDVITGYLVGATIGFMVPQLHKIKFDDRVSFSPMYNGKGFDIAYTF